jgi:hypothetical protein
LSKHEHYKELCALAALGEVPAAEASGLDRHLAGCKDCRQVYSDYLGLNAGLVPLTNERTDALIESQREAVRVAVLSTIATRPPEPTAATFRIPADTALNRTFGTVLAGAGGLAAVFAVCAFWLGTRYEQRMQVSEASPPPVIQIPSPKIQDVAEKARLHSLELSSSQLTDSLRSEKEQNTALQQALIGKDGQLAQIARDKSALERLLAAQTQELVSIQTQLAAKAGELKQAEVSRSSDAANLVALRYQVQDLTEKLNTTSASVNRERDLLASGREIRDIIGARNLHIVDVYDTDVKGRTAKPFARAFYTEGKSLVFYAYDLPAQHAQAGTYVAWGQRNGNKAALRNLGVLINDDQGQKRWMFKFNDPDVLAEIDSVFITLEPAGRDASQPSGKRMLTAYLDDQVNHP